MPKKTTTIYLVAAEGRKEATLYTSAPRAWMAARVISRARFNEGLNPVAFILCTRGALIVDDETGEASLAPTKADRLYHLRADGGNFYKATLPLELGHMWLAFGAGLAHDFKRWIFPRVRKAEASRLTYTLEPANLHTP